MISGAGGDIGFRALLFAFDDCAMGDDIGRAKGFEAAEPHAAALILQAELRDLEIFGKTGRLQHFSFSGIGTTGQQRLHSSSIG